MARNSSSIHPRWSLLVVLVTSAIGIAAAASELEHHNGNGKHRGGGAASGRRRPRIFDLVLYNHEHDMVPVRIAELGGVTDRIIFAQTAFTFANGSPKATQFPQLGLPSSDAIQRVILNVTPSACWTDRRFQGDFHPPLKMARSSAKLPWCIQSAVRNMLGVLFRQAGGTDADWALISDADEIASGSYVETLRRLNPLSTRSVLVLNSIHHYKYTLRCDEAGTFTRGPIALSGRMLRELGAQRARDGGRRSCVPVGHRGSCGKVVRRSVPRSSWQFSNFGGLQSLKYKLRTNSFAAKASLLEDELVLRRERGCHDHLDRGAAYNFNLTGFDSAHLPRTPDVPHYVEVELSGGRLPHFVDMRAPLPSQGLLDGSSASAVMATES